MRITRHKNFVRYEYLTDEELACYFKKWGSNEGVPMSARMMDACRQGARQVTVKVHPPEYRFGEDQSPEDQNPQPSSDS